MTRINTANVLDEGLRIGERGRRMNSKVKDQANKAKLVILLRQKARITSLILMCPWLASPGPSL
jgi:hypothetical protein